MPDQEPRVQCSYTYPEDSRQHGARCTNTTRASAKSGRCTIHIMTGRGRGQGCALPRAGHQHHA